MVRVRRESPSHLTTDSSGYLWFIELNMYIYKNVHLHVAKLSYLLVTDILRLRTKPSLPQPEWLLGCHMSDYWDVTWNCVTIGMSHEWLLGCHMSDYWDVTSLLGCHMSDNWESRGIVTTIGMSHEWPVQKTKAPLSYHIVWCWTRPASCRRKYPCSRADASNEHIDRLVKVQQTHEYASTGRSQLFVGVKPMVYAPLSRHWSKCIGRSWLCCDVPWRSWLPWCPWEETMLCWVELWRLRTCWWKWSHGPHMRHCGDEVDGPGVAEALLHGGHHHSMYMHTYVCIGMSHGIATAKRTFLTIFYVLWILLFTALNHHHLAVSVWYDQHATWPSHKLHDKNCGELLRAGLRELHQLQGP